MWSQNGSDGGSRYSLVGPAQPIAPSPWSEQGRAQGVTPPYTLEYPKDKTSVTPGADPNSASWRQYAELLTGLAAAGASIYGAVQGANDDMGQRMFQIVYGQQGRTPIQDEDPTKWLR